MWYVNSLSNDSWRNRGHSLAVVRQNGGSLREMGSVKSLGVRVLGIDRVPGGLAEGHLQAPDGLDLALNIQSLKERVCCLATQFDSLFRDLFSSLSSLEGQIRHNGPESVSSGFSKTPNEEPMSDTSSTLLDFLAQAFVYDYMDRRLSVDYAGWRTLTSIVACLKIPKSHAYGEARYGHAFGRPLETLIRSGIVEYRLFPGRGRGGNVTKVRVCYEREGVRRLVERLWPIPSNPDSSPHSKVDASQMVATERVTP